MGGPNGLMGGPMAQFCPRIHSKGKSSPVTQIIPQVESKHCFFAQIQLKADAILVISWTLNQQTTSIGCCRIYKYDDVSETQTNRQVDSREQGRLFIYILPVVYQIMKM